MNRENLDFSKENQTRGNRSMSYEDALKDVKMRQIGEGLGLSFQFVKGEHVMFPPISSAFPFTKKFRDSEIMYILAYSELRNRYVEIPISTFRKRPVGENELDSFYNEKERPLNCKLAEASTDLDRFKILCESGEILCEEVWDMHAYVFETDSEGKVHKTDRMKPLKVAGIALVTQ